jgi:hypothetical protein
MMENYRMASLYARAFSGGAEMFAGVCSTQSTPYFTQLRIPHCVVASYVTSQSYPFPPKIQVKPPFCPHFKFRVALLPNKPVSRCAQMRSKGLIILCFSEVETWV